jgi:hypothetical protein
MYILLPIEIHSFGYFALSRILWLVIRRESPAKYAPTAACKLLGQLNMCNVFSEYNLFYAAVTCHENPLFAAKQVHNSL